MACPRQFEKSLIVPGSARTGLIFTGLQEGARGVGADPTWPNRARYSIPCALILGSGGGGQRGGNSLAAWRGTAPVLFGRAAVWVVRFVVVFSPYLYRCCSCFPLFAVLLNCPYPDPPVSAFFFPFSSTRRRGRGGRVAFLFAGGSRNRNIKLAPRRGAGITAGLSSGC